MEKHIILGVHVTNRVQNAPRVQALLTEYGCNIKTRLGLHDVGPEFCSPSGLLILELTGDESKCAELAQKLKTISGVEVQQMQFGFP